MAVVYSCRYCGNTVGEIQEPVVEEQQLGLDRLTNEERLEMVEYNGNGDIEIKTICEHCHEALNRNPEYHELDNFLQ
ncbi:anti-sigma-F factor Fin family protein [Salirhabdus salicampi]|uniref:anti-sigma-F factor Fin family protein n=1 Tax=Salirhabdus salicampi TaxID=476102 RepID=UPI0020C2F001|nr:anti-sigma-F factor Fin family protein [Salirhabdus salicampi]MCP8618175.1 anti-sigma-F factor Fin family protein [Salirhabdus salicampi]